MASNLLAIAVTFLALPIHDTCKALPALDASVGEDIPPAMLILARVWQCWLLQSF